MKVNLLLPPDCGLLGYRFERFSLSPAKKRAKKEESLVIEPSFLKHNTDNTKYLVKMSVSHNFKNAENFWFCLEFEISGIFSWLKGIPDDKRLPYYNGLTILYGLARQAVHTICSQSACGAHLMPTVMMGTLLPVLDPLAVSQPKPEK